MQKVDKIAKALFDIEYAIKDIKNNYKNNNKDDNPIKKLSVQERDRNIYVLDSLLKIINSLKYYNYIRFPKLDEIRSICHSLKLLLDSEDYNFIFDKSFEVNNMLTRDMENEDYKKLKSLLKAYNSLNKNIKKCVAFSTLNDKEKVIYGRSFNNISFLSEYYIRYKYGMKKVNKQEIIENDMDEVSKIELIIYALNKMNNICIKEGYTILNDTIVELINKYQKELENYEEIELNNEEDNSVKLR